MNLKKEETCLQQGNVKKFEKLMKIVDIEEEDFYLFWTNWGISMIFSKDVTYDNIKGYKN